MLNLNIAQASMKIYFLTTDFQLALGLGEIKKSLNKTLGDLDP